MTRKVALITGAGGDIGAATALLFAERTYDIVAVDSSQQALAGLAQRLEATDAQCLTIKADVADEAQVQDFVQRAVTTFGSIDALINVAGIEGVVQKIVDYPCDVFDKVIAVNLRGVFLTMKYVLPILMAKGSGCIVNASSVAGFRGRPGLSAYVASKHAVVGLTRTAALETAAAGVRVNCVNPGPISGRMMHTIDGGREAKPGVGSGRPAPQVPVGRYGEPEEVAAAIGFLASDEAKFINGAIFVMDGGVTAM